MAFSAQSLAQGSGSNIDASNFSYSTLGFKLGKLTPDEEIVFLGERYEDFGIASISGSVQVASNFAIGGAISSTANDGPRTEINLSSVSGSLLFPIPLGPAADVIPQIGYLSTEAELCADSVCISEDDSAVSYGVGLRLWAVPEKLELSAAFGDNNGDNSESTVSLGIAGWSSENHRFALDFNTSDSADAVLIGYNYVW